MDVCVDLIKNNIDSGIEIGTRLDELVRGCDEIIEGIEKMAKNVADNPDNNSVSNSFVFFFKFLLRDLCAPMLLLITRPCQSFHGMV